ncbi:MAG: type II secretion system protein [Candidatus Paceibacterota bacterium]|jgi:prepilin-type N-terminal cleavage/methylation domain-containing protein
MTMKKGFTLIELLVVIAIIGILSGLIIVSMGGAQNSAKDARIKTSMDQMRTVGALYYNTNSTYGTGVAGAATNFTGTGEGLMLFNDIDNQNGDGDIEFVAGTGVYCFSAEMNSGTMCIDSTGKVGSAVCNTATACP